MRKKSVTSNIHGRYVRQSMEDCPEKYFIVSPQPYLSSSWAYEQLS